jgi:hypothetical protein
MRGRLLQKWRDVLGAQRALINYLETGLKRL